MLDESLQNAMSSVPNCIAIGAVDLTSGTLLALQADEERPQEMLNVMTSTVTELFEAPLLQAFSEIYSPDAEEKAKGKQFNELLLLNDHHNYLLLRGRERRQLAVIIIATKETPVGLLMMKGMAVLPSIEQAI